MSGGRSRRDSDKVGITRGHESPRSRRSPISRSATAAAAVLHDPLSAHQHASVGGSSSSRGDPRSVRCVHGVPASPWEAHLAGSSAYKPDLRCPAKPTRTAAGAGAAANGVQLSSCPCAHVCSQGPFALELHTGSCWGGFAQATQTR